MSDSDGDVRPLNPFWLSPPLLSPISDSDYEPDDAVGGAGGAVPLVDPPVEVPCLVLARARARLSVASVTPPRAPRGRRWARDLIFPHALAVAAVRAVRAGLVPPPPGFVEPRRSRRIARLPPVDVTEEEEFLRRNRRRLALSEGVHSPPVP